MTASEFPPALRPAFVFCRHAESVAAAQGLVAGSWDVPLTALGERQARSAAEALSGIGIARVLTSDLARARQTAAAIAVPRELEVEIMPGLRERAWGPYEGGPDDARPPGVLDPPGAEPWAAFAARVASALVGVTGSGPVLIVAHRGIYRVLMSSFGRPHAGPGMDFANPCRIGAATGEVSSIRSRSDI